MNQSFFRWMRGSSPRMTSQEQQPPVLEGRAKMAGGILQRAIDIRVAHRDFVHSTAVRAFHFQRRLPGGLKALHIGLNAGGRLVMCYRASEQ
jgi:hypothetical protein